MTPWRAPVGKLSMPGLLVGLVTTLHCGAVATASGEAGSAARSGRLMRSQGAGLEAGEEQATIRKVMQPINAHAEIEELSAAATSGDGGVEAGEVLAVVGPTGVASPADGSMLERAGQRPLAEDSEAAKDEGLGHQQVFAKTRTRGAKLMAKAMTTQAPSAGDPDHSEDDTGEDYTDAPPDWVPGAPVARKTPSTTATASQTDHDVYRDAYADADRRAEAFEQTDVGKSSKTPDVTEDDAALARVSGREELDRQEVHAKTRTPGAKLMTKAMKSEKLEDMEDPDHSRDDTGEDYTDAPKDWKPGEPMGVERRTATTTPPASAEGADQGEIDAQDGTASSSSEDTAYTEADESSQALEQTNDVGAGSTEPDTTSREEEPSKSDLRVTGEEEQPEASGSTSDTEDQPEPPEPEDPENVEQKGSSEDPETSAESQEDQPSLFEMSGTATESAEAGTDGPEHPDSPPGELLRSAVGAEEQSQTLATSAEQLPDTLAKSAEELPKPLAAAQEPPQFVAMSAERQPRSLAKAAERQQPEWPTGVAEEPPKSLAATEQQRQFVATGAEQQPEPLAIAAEQQPKTLAKNAGEPPHSLTATEQQPQFVATGAERRLEAEQQPETPAKNAEENPHHLAATEQQPQFVATGAEQQRESPAKAMEQQREVPAKNAEDPTSLTAAGQQPPLVAMSRGQHIESSAKTREQQPETLANGAEEPPGALAAAAIAQQTQFVARSAGKQPEFPMKASGPQPTTLAKSVEERPQSFMKTSLGAPRAMAAENEVGLVAESKRTALHDGARRQEQQARVLVKAKGSADEASAGSGSPADTGDTPKDTGEDDEMEKAASSNDPGSNGQTAEDDEANEDKDPGPNDVDEEQTELLSDAEPPLEVQSADDAVDLLEEESAADPGAALVDGTAAGNSTRGRESMGSSTLCGHEGQECSCSGIVGYGRFLFRVFKRVEGKIGCNADTFDEVPDVEGTRNCHCYSMASCEAIMKKDPNKVIDPAHRRRSRLGKVGFGMHQRRRWCGFGPMNV